MRTFRLVAFAAALAGTAFSQFGCSADGTIQDAETVGTLRMPLTATSTSGAVYRLRNAQIELAGPQFETFSTEDYLNQPSVQLTLASGSYEASLGGGWTLEKEDAGAFQPVSAVLLSANPQNFEINDELNTVLEFVFQSDGQVINFGEGTVEVIVTVQDTPLPAENTLSLCTDGFDNDADGGVDCTDSECTAFCDTSLVIWSYEQPSPGGSLSLSADPSNAFYFMDHGQQVSYLDTGSPLWTVEGGPFTLPLQDSAALGAGGVVVVGGLPGSAIEATAFDEGGSVLYFQPLPGGSGGGPDYAVRVGAVGAQEAVVASSFGPDVRVHRLSPAGSPLWERTILNGGSPVLAAEVGGPIAVLSSPPGQIRGTLLSPGGSTMAQFLHPLPADGQALAGSVQPGGTTMGVYVRRTGLPILSRYVFDSTGALVGIDELPLLGTATAAFGGLDGLVAVADESAQVRVFDEVGGIVADFPANAGHLYQELSWNNAGVLCGAGHDASTSTSYVDCYSL